MVAEIIRQVLSERLKYLGGFYKGKSRIHRACRNLSAPDKKGRLGIRLLSRSESLGQRLCYRDCAKDNRIRFRRIKSAGSFRDRGQRPSGFDSGFGKSRDALFVL